MMMQLIIQGLHSYYAAIEKAIDAACETDRLTEDEQEEAYGALSRLAETLILSSASYQGMTNATDIARQCALDKQYVAGCLSEEEMKQREDWHWKRIQEQNPIPKD